MSLVDNMTLHALFFQEVKQERKTLHEIKISTNAGPRDLVKTENQPYFCFVSSIGLLLATDCLVHLCLDLVLDSSIW